MVQMAERVREKAMVRNDADANADADGFSKDDDEPIDLE